MNALWQSGVGALSSMMTTIATWLVPYLGDIALMLVVCVVALYADVVYRFTKRTVARRHFVVRTFAFVLITAFGFTALVMGLSPWLTHALHAVPSTWLPLAVVGLFTLLGVLADRKNQL